MSLRISCVHSWIICTLCTHVWGRDIVVVIASLSFQLCHAILIMPWSSHSRQAHAVIVIPASLPSCRLSCHHRNILRLSSCHGCYILIHHCLHFTEWYLKRTSWLKSAAVINPQTHILSSLRMDENCVWTKAGELSAAPFLRHDAKKWWTTLGRHA